MRTLVLSLFFGMAVISPSFAWTIFLKEPELFPIWEKNTKTVQEVKERMKKMDFKSGVVFVSAPKPTRNLRFGAPGQSVNELVPLLKKLGFKVRVAFSDSMDPEWGFVMGQLERDAKDLTITINIKHKQFDRELLKLKGK